VQTKVERARDGDGDGGKKKKTYRFDFVLGFAFLSNP